MKFLELRHRAKQLTRQYFDSQGFIEVDSPVLIPANAVEAFIDPIWVGDLELRTSPEIYHKRLLAHGCQKIYELGHVFRDEQPGRIHLREFSLLEWYRVGASLTDLIQDCEQLFSGIARHCERSEAIQGSWIATSPTAPRNDELFPVPFEIKTLQELWFEHACIDLRQALLENNLVMRVQEAGFVLRENADFGDAFHHVMLSAIEPNIGSERPCVVTRWPRELAALSRLCEDDCLFAERFEIYFKQVELANAFLELTDPVEQQTRFEAEAHLRQQLGKKSSKLDTAFLKDLASMPPTAGIAVGFDRLLMLVSGALDIGEVSCRSNFKNKI